MLPIIVFLGSIAGIAQVLISPEEMRPGYKHLIWMQNILFAIICIEAIWLLNPIISFLGIGVIFLLRWKAATWLLVLLLSPLAWMGGTMTILLFLLVMTMVSIDSYEHIRNESLTQKKSFLSMTLVKYIWILPAGFIPILIS